MPVSERVARLRQGSLDAAPAIAAERAELMTTFYAQRSLSSTCWSTRPFASTRAS
jgi:hypothetical protein